jgi:hypothetical protein
MEPKNKRERNRAELSESPSLIHPLRLRSSLAHAVVALSQRPSRFQLPWTRDLSR